MENTVYIEIYTFLMCLLPCIFKVTVNKIQQMHLDCFIIL
jgi:hypothetical protein